MLKHEEFHWMWGLEDYFEAVDSPHKELYGQLVRAVLLGEQWAVRDMLLREVQRGWKPESENFVNLILNNLLTELPSHANRDVLQYISHSFEDDFIKRISAWSIKWGERTNVNDHFSRGQMISKLWMVGVMDMLKLQPKDIVMYGGWYATVAFFIFNNYPDVRFTNLEIDRDVLDVANDFNYPQYKNGQFKSNVKDVNTIAWKGDGFQVGRDFISPDLIINTSCEHMTDEWFYNIPDGKTIILQTNDYFSNEQHINCVKDLDAAVEKYKFSELLYKGTRDTGLYNRFMLVGRK